MSYLMGIDVGTTGTRVVIVRPDGHVMGAATGDHQPMRMVTTGTIVGSVTDESNAVLYPSLIWCDQRSHVQCEWITSRVGAERLIKLVLNPALTGFSAPKLLWVREHEPQVYERAAHFLLPKDFVRLRLTGEFATDVSDASGTLLFDVTHRRWSRAILAALEIDPALLPRAYESPEITGQITRETSLVTGLTAGTPVVAGGGDQASSAVGNGIVLPGLTSATALFEPLLGVRVR